MPRITPRHLALIPIAVGVNLALGKVAAITALPLFLDTVGTILVAALVGLWPALLTGTLSQAAFVITPGGGNNAIWLAFLPVQLAIGGYAALAARQGWFRSNATAFGAGAALGCVAAALSWPISYFAFGGVTAGGVTLLTTALTGAGLALKWAVLVASLTNDVLDKTVSFLMVRVILTSLPARAAARFPAVQRALGRPGP